MFAGSIASRRRWRPRDPLLTTCVVVVDHHALVEHPLEHLGKPRLVG